MIWELKTFKKMVKEAKEIIRNLEAIDWEVEDDEV